MFPIALVHVPVLLFATLPLPQPTTACQLEVLTPQTLEERTLAQFNRSVERYAALHRRLERSLPPEQMFDDPEDMFGAREALAAALRQARPNARAGNVFTPAVAELITARLAAAMREHGHDAADILAAISDERLPGMLKPEVNGEYPRGIVSAMWPALLHALPPLPRELEYRFFDRNLVLIDVHANLVLDVLDDALPPGERTSGGSRVR